MVKLWKIGLKLSTIVIGQHNIGSKSRKRFEELQITRGKSNSLWVKFTLQIYLDKFLFN